MTSRMPSRASAFSSTTLFGATLLAFAAGCGALPSTTNHEEDPIIRTTCSETRPCEAGLVCEAGQCVEAPPPECVANADCATGEFCNADGVCKPSIDPNQGKKDPEKKVCAKGTLALVSHPPTVVVLVDQSASMTQAFDGGTRWDVLRDALLNEQTGIVKQLENDVRFGIALYSSVNGYGKNHQRTCPLLEGLDEVPIGFGNHAAIRDVYAAASPVDDTPTAESLAAVTDKLVALPNEGAKIIVLATDGEPDTCDDSDAHNADTNRLSVETARASHAAGVHTYVMSVGSEIAEAHLQQMANAGAGVPDGGADAAFYKATDQAGLKSALGSIVSELVSCSFHLEGTVDTSLVEKGTVLLDGEALVYGTDWTLNAAGDVELLGARCRALKTGNHDVKAEFACVEGGVPIVR
jgi:hypothetical protein